MKQLSSRMFAKVHTSNNLKRVLKQTNKATDRNDSLKYTNLIENERFEDLGDKIHPDLKEALRANNYTYMTDI